MNATNEITVKVTGMSCSHCEATVKRSLEEMENISNVEANRDLQEVKITGSDIDLELVKEKINNLGYKFVG